jgi:serine protease Do
MKPFVRLIRSSALLLALAGALRLTAAETKEMTPLDLARQLNQAFVEVSEKVSRSVVIIKVAHKPSFRAENNPGNPFRTDPPRAGEPRLRKPKEPVFDSQGSGLVIREDGYILTNFHVVEEAEKIRVRFNDGQEFEATVQGTDVQSDLAVIHVDAKGLKAAKFADSSAARVGEFAIAIGAPYELEYSVTVGHLSAKGRSRVLEDPAMDQDFLQTDANINPGNSGGPLVNLEGEVMGINTLIQGLHTGISFAIPSNLAREVAGQLIENGRYVRNWLGVSITSFKEEPEYRKLAKGLTDGVVVREIVPDGPASKSDLKAQDIILTVDGRAVTTSQQLRTEIRAKAVGQWVTLGIFRNGNSLAVKVRPEAWPEDRQNAHLEKEKPDKALGLTLKVLTPELAKKYGIKERQGVLITDVEAGSVAEEQGLKTGDVITEIDRKMVTDIKECRDALQSADARKGAEVRLAGQGAGRQVRLKPRRE